MKRSVRTQENEPIPSRKAYTWAGVFLVTFLIIICYRIVIPGRISTVKYTDAGFSPAETTVREGGVVVFENASSNAFWPASNFHPSHTLYPEFDAARPVKPGESWQFTFTDSGIWRYHDHANSRKTGTVRVLPSVFTWVRSRTRCTDAALRSASVQAKERCYIQTIESVLSKKGIDAAFESLREIYDAHPEFSWSCHDVTHLLGEAAYREFRKNASAVTTDKTSYCGFGFYHGFIEALLFTTGRFDHATDYCTRIGQSGRKVTDAEQAVDACYHGFGHGALDTFPIDKWGHDAAMVREGISICEQVIPESEPHFREQCASGIFNALANAYSNNRYYVKFNTEDPFAICKNPEYAAYASSCFMEVGTAYISSNSIGRDDAIKFLTAAIRQGAPADILVGYFSDQVRRETGNKDLGGYAETCMSFDREALNLACIDGIIAGAFVWGKPNQQYIQGNTFCSALGSGRALQEYCMHKIFYRMKFVVPESSRKEACALFTKPYASQCMGKQP